MRVWRSSHSGPEPCPVHQSILCSAIPEFLLLGLSWGESFDSAWIDPVLFCRWQLAVQTCSDLYMSQEVIIASIQKPSYHLSNVWLITFGYQRSLRKWPWPSVHMEKLCASLWSPSGGCSPTQWAWTERVSLLSLWLTGLSVSWFACSFCNFILWHKHLWCWCLFIFQLWISNSSLCLWQASSSSFMQRPWASKYPFLYL